MPIKLQDPFSEIHCNKYKDDSLDNRKIHQSDSTNKAQRSYPSVCQAPNPSLPQSVFNDFQYLNKIILLHSANPTGGGRQTLRWSRSQEKCNHNKTYKAIKVPDQRDNHQAFQQSCCTGLQSLAHHKYQ
uniref:Profilin n=1 Tax=Rhizophora mucronata TaxID=61149 RepID=A0A2P2JRW2_RHIMU